LPITCDTSDAPTLVWYLFEGECTGRDILQRRLELITAGQLTAKTAVLFDLRRATTFTNVGDLATVVRPGAVWPVCRAFLVNTPAQYDAAGQLQALLGPDAVINQIFQDEAKALEWLSAMVGRSHAIR
jgi:hypothetical protein